MKNKKVDPDEYFRHGGMEFSRFGKNILMRSNWTDEDLQKRHKIFIAKLPLIEASIDALIEETSSLVRRHDPLRILHRAYWGMAYHHIGLFSESRASETAVQSVRTLEFLQNLIASQPQSESTRNDISEEEWKTISEKISTIYKRINHDFLLAESIRSKVDEGIGDDEGHLRFRSLLHWINVRGERYSVHEKDHLKDLLICQSEIMESIFGVTAEEFIEEMHKILIALTEGVGIAANDLRDLDEIYQKELQAALEEQSLNLRSMDEVYALMRSVMERKGLTDRHQDVVGRFIGCDLFDLQKSTTLPISVLEKLSWKPGEERTFFAGDKFRGWPLKVTPISRRPFISIDGGFYCFNAFSLFDNLYRTIQRIAFEKLPSKKQKWIENQAANSEAIALGYFERLIPGSRRLSQVYYKWYPSRGSHKKEWCETDGIVIYGDHLIILEVKAGSFTYTSPYDDFEAHAQSMRTLILKPADQGARFIEYLENAPEVTLFDSAKNPVVAISSKDFRRITICGMTVDPFTEIAAQIEHLSPLGISVAESPVWSVSLDDLRICSEIFTNPLVFLHYLEKRVDAMKSKIMNLDDELDHVGLYLEHNDYVLHASDLLKQNSSNHLSFNGYREKIDAYFHEKQFNPNASNPLSQQIPSIYREILEFCQHDKSRAWTDLARFLLNTDGKCRSEISDGVRIAIESQATRRRVQILSTGGEVRLTIACWQPHIFRPDSEFALKHAKTELFLRHQDDRMLLELFFNPAGRIYRILWSEVKKAEIPLVEVSRFQQAAERMKIRRMNLAVERGQRPERNSQCPCGSGLKYKRCCLNAE